MKTLFAVLCIGLSPPAASAAQEAKPMKVTVQVSGVVDEDTAAALRKRLGKAPGIKVNVDDLQPRDQPDHFKNYFSKPFAIELTDPARTDLGAVARAIAETKTPKKVERDPWLNLVLFHPTGTLEERDVSALREAVADVSGVDARSVGGTGGFRLEGSFWVRLDGSGTAKLAEIQAALKKANLDLHLNKP